MTSALGKASPLAGKRVVNTRAAHQAAELDQHLRDHGAIPLSFPCIAIGPPTDPTPLDAALARLAEGGFEWVVFTSANTVEAVAGRPHAMAPIEPARSGEGQPARGSATATSVAGGPWGSRNEAPSACHPDPHTGHPGPQTRHPERSEGSPRSPSALLDEPRALHDHPGAGAREPAKGSPTGTGGIVERPVGGGIGNLRIPASERRLDLGPGVQARAAAVNLVALAKTPAATTPARVAAVGPATAEAVARLLGWPVDVRPEVETAAALGRAIPVAPGDRVLLPKSALAGPELAAILRGRGAAVTEAVAYETTTGAGGVDLASLLAAGEVDAVCFTSGSTVRGCIERLGGAVLPDAVRVACIGPETAAVAASLGLRAEVVPAEHTAQAMVAALAASFADGAW